MIALQKGKAIWLILLLLVIGSNIAIYNTTLYNTFNIEQNPQVVIGSLLDLIVVAPILAIIYLKKYSWKTAVGLIATGCIVARFVIPSTLLNPYKYITTVGIAVELLIILFELMLITLLLVYLPKIVLQVKASTAPMVFSFPHALDNFSKNPIIKVLSSEMLVFYYAFASWRKQQPSGITLYKNTSYFSFNIMLIHAIVLESLGFHWWLHSKAPIVSIILLIINVYGVIFLIADMRAMKLNPIQIQHTGFYISLGLFRRTYIDYRDIEEVILNAEVKQFKECAEFIAQDFITAPPQMVLKMKQPQQVDMLYGLKKYCEYVAISCDDATQLLAKIEEGRGQ